MCPCTNNHCHVSRCKLADLRHQHLYSGYCLIVYLPVSDTICYSENTTCLDDFGFPACTKVIKTETRPATYVTMVVGSIYCDKIVYTKKEMLSTTWQTCIDASSYASLNSNRAFIYRIEGTDTVNFKMFKGTIFMGYQNRNSLLSAEHPSRSNLWFDAS